MELRLADPSQLEALLSLYDGARAFMAETGNPNQWTDGYPDREQLLQDLQQEQLYVCMEEDQILAAFVFFQGDEPTYREILQGQWRNSLPYGVVHRLCAAEHGRGLGAFCLNWCFGQCGNLRIDTHKDNLPMQALLRRCGFVLCGIVHVRDGSERLAFQKTSE